MWCFLGSRPGLGLDLNSGIFPSKTYRRRFLPDVSRFWPADRAREVVALATTWAKFSPFDRLSSVKLSAFKLWGFAAFPALFASRDKWRWLFEWFFRLFGLEVFEFEHFSKASFWALTSLTGRSIFLHLTCRKNHDLGIPGQLKCGWIG